MSNKEIEYSLTTKQYAAQFGVKPISVRIRLCKTGSYFGDVPKRCVNGRLLWPNARPEVVDVTPSGARK